jgi:hypothetical protein
VKDVMRMTIEILKGYEFGDSRSFIPVKYDKLQSWKQLEKEVAEIYAKGGVVDLPGYECQYTEYDPETGTYTVTPPPVVRPPSKPNAEPVAKNSWTLATTNCPAVTGPNGGHWTSAGSATQSTADSSAR